MAFGWYAPGLKKLAKTWEVDKVEPQLSNIHYPNPQLSKRYFKF